MAFLPGFEPRFSVPETDVLSIELQELNLADIAASRTLVNRKTFGKNLIAIKSSVDLFSRMARRTTVTVHVGDLALGSQHPIRVQSMTNTKTEDVSETIRQIWQLYDAHCEIVRITVPNLNAVTALKDIKRQLVADHIALPIVADVHFSPSVAIACVPYADKVRINPGNFHNLKEFETLIRIAKKEGKSIRIGVNHGSIQPALLQQYGHTPEAMYQSLLPFLNIARRESFNAIVLSFKSSSVPDAVMCNRELAKRLDEDGFHFPIHLGITEAGNGEMGRMKGAIGIGSLLLDGIGDTIRVSLTEDPVNEVAAAYNILQATQRRITQTEYVACPSCGRTQFDIQNVLEKIKQATAHLKNIKIAVMGCIVNGLGELADADYGYIGAGPGTVNIYAHGQCVKTNISEAFAIQALLDIIHADGHSKSC